MQGNIVQTKPTKSILKLIIPIIILVLILAVFIWDGYVIVEPGYRGVSVTLGKVNPTVLNEGFHFKIPLIQEVIPMDVKVQKAQSEETASSKDLQTVEAVIAVNYRLNPEMVHKLYDDLRLSYKEIIVDPAIAESLKSVTAQYTAEELISKRAEVSSKVKETLGKKLSTYYMILNEINITEFRFSEEFDAAIEQKQIAEQQALKANLDLQRIQVEAQQLIEQAKAQAEALRMQKDVITPELVELRKVEAQLEAIKKWDGKLPSVTGTGAVPFIDINELKQ
ncbi:MAG: prohibitin family protein [Peptococcaceae bacterium]|jgi:regulator of protease activity HflC (stomatin/prohibitin superfamily)|nr:prohibitin family protein [Peptococcaceae bacterium]